MNELARVRTMHIRILSDLHLEFYLDWGRSFVRELVAGNEDVLILAGDLTTSDFLLDTLLMVADKFSRVIYTLGNHEYYGSDRSKVYAAVRKATDRCRNLHWLECSSVEIGGIRFVGATLWFPPCPEAPKSRLNDFRLIHGFEDWVYDDNRRAVSYLGDAVDPGVVVVTHHLPSRRSVAGKFVGSPLNPFFVSDVEEIILKQQPALWVHGHTHCSMNYMVERTSVICNPFGYHNHEENPAFNPNLIIAIPVC